MIASAQIDRFFDRYSEIEAERDKTPAVQTPAK
jgi:hypothetical protein